MPWYFYLAIKQLFPTGRVTSFFSLVSILGVTIGVAVLVCVLSVMNGFGHEIKSKLVDTGGHVTIRGQGFVSDPEEITAIAESQPEVAAANAVARGVVMAQHDNIPTFPVMYTIDVNAEQQVIPIEKYLIMGTLDDLDDESVFISSGVARSLRARTGDTLDVFTPLMLQKMKEDQLLLPRELEVAGVFETGFSEVDKNTILITLRLGRELYDLGGSAHEITVRLHERDKAPLVAEALNRQLPEPLEARTFLEINQGFLFVLQLERGLTMLITVFTVLVAAFSISSSLFTAVVRKTREIGLLGAMGGRPWQNAMIFTFQGVIVGLVGYVAGVTLALVLLTFRQDIVVGLGKIAGQDDFMLQYYPLANLPVHYRPDDFLLVALFTIGTAVLAGLIPALRAAKLRPSEALRNE